MAYKIYILIFFLVGLSTQSLTQDEIKHDKWTILLAKHVNNNGNVDYAGFKKDEKELDEYLALLETNPPQESWPANQQLAFWINAYNAFTVKLITKNYPVKSIKELGGGIYKVNTPWDIKFITIGEETYDLNNIEHGIVRKQFKEPRIHFAMVCAAISCPRLRNEAYTAEKLDNQLDDQAKKFINNKEKNIIKEETAELSKIFSWFRGDFSKNDSSVEQFINKYSEIKINSKTKISYNKYDWRLNE